MTVVRARPAESPKRGGGGGWLFAAAAVLVAVCAVVLVVSSGASAPDPNYVRARDSVAAYEHGKAILDRDYDHRVYREALALLELVGPDSVSAEPAAQLASEIKRRMDEFHARLKAEEERRAREVRLRRERQEALFKAQMRARMNPQTEYPECEEGGEGGHGH
jgi:hypothetical protein